jgi:hypothetical protein
VGIVCALPEGWRSASLSVHDVAGRVIRRLAVPAETYGFVPIEWDGATDSGVRAASGVYFIQLEVDGEAARRKMLLLR